MWMFVNGSFVNLGVCKGCQFYYSGRGSETVVFFRTWSGDEEFEEEIYKIDKGMTSPEVDAMVDALNVQLRNFLTSKIVVCDMKYLIAEAVVLSQHEKERKDG